MIESKIQIRDGQTEINYYQQGQGETTLLFLHGWCIDAKYWENQIEYFAKDNSVYCLDLPGFGKSTAKRECWTIEEYAKDVLAFIEILNLKKVVLVGHSMAGDIILETALSNNPEIIGIVGIDNFKFIDVEFPPEFIEQMQAFFKMLESDFETAAPNYAENYLFHASTQPEIKERIKKDFAKANPSIGYNTFMSIMQYSQGVSKRLQDLNYKLHLISCDYVPTNTAGLEARCKNGFEIKMINNTGHYPMIEKPAEFNQLLDEILAIST